MKQKLLLTGSAGFIYSNFIRKMMYEKHQYELVCIDKFADSRQLNNVYHHNNIKLYVADITDEHIINRIFELEKPEIVLHTAAESSVDKSINDVNVFVKSNVLGTQNLLNASNKNKIDRFIQVSTDEVYGSLNSEQSQSWTEKSPLDPKNPYASSKASADLMVQSNYNAHGLKYNIIRSSNNYGFRQLPDKLIPRVIRCILKNEKIPVYGKGEQIRDWLYVMDNCSAVLKVLEAGKSNEIYNVGAGQEFTNIEIVNEICNIMGKGQELITFIQDPRGAAHDFRYSVNCDKLKSLGWDITTKVKSGGLAKVCEWYLDNKWFLE